MAPETSACTLLAEAGEPVTTLAVTEAIDPDRAPRPTNDSERLLFRQLYETLVRVDCQGRAQPGLAASWRLDGDGRTWILTLRENARFADGTPFTAADVRAGWTRDDGAALRRDVSRLVQSVNAVDERTLAIVFARQRGDVPLALAHPDLAIARRTTASPWPTGTRPGWTINGTLQPGRAATLTVTRNGLSELRVLVAPGDPRDLLDQDIDLLLTRDPAALEYAATLPHFQLLPLAWQRTLLLLTPGRSRAALPAEARQALADDAVRGEARGAEEPFWWQGLSGCDAAPLPPLTQAAPAARIVYDAGERAARDVAERLVGLRTYQRAAGLTGDALVRARRIGADAAYLVSVDARPLDPCRELQAMMDATPWLDPQMIVPLIDTRLNAIVRRGHGRLTVDWDGGLHLP